MYERVALLMGSARGATMAAGYAGSETLQQNSCGSGCYWCGAQPSHYCCRHRERVAAGSGRLILCSLSSHQSLRADAMVQTHLAAATRRVAAQA